MKTAEVKPTYAPSPTALGVSTQKIRTSTQKITYVPETCPLFTTVSASLIRDFIPP